MAEPVPKARLAVFYCEKGVLSWAKNAKSAGASWRVPLLRFSVPLFLQQEYLDMAGPLPLLPN
jgi:hypothetical protein